MLLWLSKSFCAIFIETLNQNVNNLKFKFNEDKIIFFEHFKLLYSKEGI